MKNKYLFLAVFFFVYLFCGSNISAQDKINIKLFYSPSCKACAKIKQEYLPKIISRYKDKISIEYVNVAEPENLKTYLSLEKKLKKQPKVPLALIGSHALIGASQIEIYLEPLIEKYASGEYSQDKNLVLGKEDLLHKFKNLSYLAIIFAGLIDGINPCAFTVLIFFISFLTFMGYRNKGILAIGLTFVFAVFLTYLAIGLGLFRGFYELGKFYIIIKVLYYFTAGVCFILAYLNLSDFTKYLKTKKTDSFKTKLPKAVRSRINSIISVFYRPEQKDKFKSKLALVIGTFIVGFIVSLLEAVCTGQVYLPVIVLILKEPGMRIKAVTYLLLYNFMFIIPLLAILFVAILGASSKKLEEFFKSKIAFIKFLMFCLFFGLGMFLILGI
ncbi:MAG: hypothetical protein PHG69_00545 [Candidatus Omnitrophica bacterium]|nr:hypothetical protein [Candidatus Omnitrophota bacterium]